MSKSKKKMKSDLKSTKVILIFNIFKLSFRNIFRNKRRSLVLAIGIITSIGILSGIFAYVDTSSTQLMARSMDNLSVDLSMNFTNRSATIENVTQIIDALDTLPEVELYKSIDPIIGGFPFSINQRMGFAISNGSDYDLNYYLPDAQGSFLSAFAFGLTGDYLNLKNSPFRFLGDNLDEIRDDEVLISKSIADQLNIGIGDTINASYAYGIALPNLVIPSNSIKLKVKGLVEVDLGLMLDNLEAYIPEIADLLDEDLVSLIQFQAISTEMYFMNWETMLSFTQDYSNLRFIHGIHFSLDSEELGSEVDEVRVQLLTVEIKLASQFPDLIINNYAYDELQLIEDKLINYRLFILYFSLPGLILGFIFTLFVNNLTLEQRQKELAILRLRNTNLWVIQYLIAAEVFLLSFIGTIIGFLFGTTLGYILSTFEKLKEISVFSLSSISDLGIHFSFSNIFSNLSKDSIYSSIFIGLVLTGIITVSFVRKLSKLELHAEIRSAKSEEVSFWMKYKIDYILVITGIVIFLMDIFDLNPIPNFARALYDLIIPIFVWIGYTLLSLRIISWILQIGQKQIISLFRFMLKAPGIAVAKSIIRNKNQIFAPILILILTLAFSLTIANISTTFEYQADNEANYSVGADIRIQFPAQDQLEYKTVDFKNAIDDIDGITSTEMFITLFGFGNQLSLAIILDPAEFLEIAYFREDFFYYNTPRESLTRLSQLEGGLGMIISFNLGFPFADGYDDISVGPATFKQNDTVPFRQGTISYEISILDIAIRFPGLDDMVGRPSEDLPYLLFDRRFFAEPLPGQTVAIAPELANSTHLYVDVDEDIISIEEATAAIDEVYEQFEASYSLDIRTKEEFKEEFFELGDLLVGLSILEFVMVFIVLNMTMFLFIFSSYSHRQKDFAILQGIGWQNKHINYFIISQLFIITIFSIFISLVVSLIETLAYIPLLSSLFSFPVTEVIYSKVAIYSAIGITIISAAISGYMQKRFVKGANIAEILREG